MAKRRGANAEERTRVDPRAAPRSLALAAKGIQTGHDFANVMSALMSDLIEGRIAPNIGNATCNAGGKLLKVVEMSYRYGTDGPGQRKILMLALESPVVPSSAA
jgi:hypothetical protein